MGERRNERERGTEGNREREGFREKRGDIDQVTYFQAQTY